MSRPVLFAGIPGAPNWWTRLRVWLIMAAVLALYFWSARGTGFNLAQVFSGLPQMGDLLARMLPYERIRLENDALQYTWSWELARRQVLYVGETWGPLMETLRIAIVSAGAGALLAVPFSLLAARNLARYQWLYWTVRSFLSILRTVPDMVLAALFVSAFGIGALAGVTAVTIFSWAIMAKLMSESVEAIDPGPVEALTATGANRLQVIRYAVMPQVLPQFSSYALYVFEIDVRASTVLGWVGAGGIGQLLRTQLNFFKFRDVMVIIMVTLAVVILIDYASNRIRERLL